MGLLATPIYRARDPVEFWTKKAS